jgi:hypothetical protein
VAAPVAAPVAELVSVKLVEHVSEEEIEPSFEKDTSIEKNVLV